MIGWWIAGWEHFALGVVPRHVVAFERYAGLEVYGVQVHHPWGRSIEDGKPGVMEFAQRRACRRDFEKTGNVKLRHALDDAGFVRAMNRLSANWRLMIYMGSPHQLRPFPNESMAAWVERARDVYGPVLQISPSAAIGMDATYGQPYVEDPTSRYHVTGGPNGSLAMLVRHLTTAGHEVFFEGAILYDAKWALKLCSTYTTDRWWEVPARGQQHGRPGWGRFAKPGVESGGTTMIEVLTKGSSEERLEQIEGHLAAGRDVAVQPTQLPGYPWN